MTNKSFTVRTLMGALMAGVAGALAGCPAAPLDSDQPPSEDPANQPQTTVMNPWAVPDTNQTDCFNDSGPIICPTAGDPFFGQDAQYTNHPPSYTDNGDGTVTDQVTGLMWQKAFTVADFADAETTADAATLAGYHDWRVPTIKELYSLIDFSGNQGSAPPEMSTPPADAAPFLDTSVFDFEYPTDGRYIDAQYISSTEYTSTTMNGSATFFGVNFADGRIKGYPQVAPQRFGYYLRLVRGEKYGVNRFLDNGDRTITDQATGLMWTQADSGDHAFAAAVSGYTHADGALNWAEALDFAENLTHAGHSDWRLPNAKELQAIVDYTRSPDATNSPAIDPLFETTTIINEAGDADYPFYWTSTTFEPGADAVYVAFGRGLGYLDLGSGPRFYDVHGAGCQRTDPKIGTPAFGVGPQGDVRRIFNHARCVRDAE
jgi:hypothetical protein